MYFIKYIVCLQFIFTTLIKMITEWRANIWVWWLTGWFGRQICPFSLNAVILITFFLFFAKLLLCRYRLIVVFVITYHVRFFLFHRYFAYRYNVRCMREHVNRRAERDSGIAIAAHECMENSKIHASVYVDVLNTITCIVCRLDGNFIFIVIKVYWTEINWIGFIYGIKCLHFSLFDFLKMGWMKKKQENYGQMWVQISVLLNVRFILFLKLMSISKLAFLKYGACVFWIKWRLMEFKVKIILYEHNLCLNILHGWF